MTGVQTCALPISAAPTAAPGATGTQLATLDFVINMAFSAALPALVTGRILSNDGVAAGWYTPASLSILTSTGASSVSNKTLVVADNTITTAATGNLSATELNAALAELQGDIDTVTNVTAVKTAIQEQAYSVFTPGGTVDAVTGTLSPAITSYATNLRVTFTPSGANTITAPTLNLNTIGVRTIKKKDPTGTKVALVATDLNISGPSDLVYDGVDFVLMNPPVAVGVTAGNVIQVNQAVTATTRSATTTLGTTLLHTLSDTSTTITAFNGVAGVTYHCRTLGAGSITYHATDMIITQTGASVTTAAGDTFDVYMLTASTCRITNYQKASGAALTGSTPISKFINFSRDLTVASGDVSYTGVGFTPSRLFICSTINNSFWMVGEANPNRDSVSQMYNFTGPKNAAFSGVAPGIICGYANDGSGATSNLGTLKTYDADGFTVTWTKTGSPSGTLFIQALCYK